MAPPSKTPPNGSPLERGREILREEARALEHAAQELDAHFVRLVERILDLNGKVVVTGVGKSGLIGGKIAATLSSTGTPALFMHAVEAVHGDLGILGRDDLLLAISNSGETNEVVNVVLAAKKIGTATVAVTRNPESSLANSCDDVLPLSVLRETGHLGLAPTTSTTVTLGLGDALALTLMELRAFTPEQFAVFHPGGALGRRLAVEVADIMRTGDLIPCVNESTSVPAALATLSGDKSLGGTLVVDESGRLTGIFTDGDLRRALLGPSPDTVLSRPVSELMTRRPMTVDADAKAAEALRIMETRGIMHLPIVDSKGRPAGILHLHDILGRGEIVI